MQPGFHKSVCGGNVSSAVWSVSAKLQSRWKATAEEKRLRDARSPGSETADLQEFADNVISKKWEENKPSDADSAGKYEIR